MKRELQKSDHILLSVMFLVIGILYAWGAYFAYAEGSWEGVVVIGTGAVLSALAGLGYLLEAVHQRKREGNDA